MYEIKTFFNGDVVKCERLRQSEKESYDYLRQYIKDIEAELSIPAYLDMVDTEVLIRFCELREDLMFPIVLGEYSLNKDYNCKPSGGGGFFITEDSVEHFL